MTQGQFFKRIPSFPSPRLVASPRLKDLVCSTILPIAGGRIIGFIPFPRVLVLCEMQSVLSRIWTRVAMSISYDDNHNNLIIYIYIYRYIHIYIYREREIQGVFSEVIILIYPIETPRHFKYYNITSTTLDIANTHRDTDRCVQTHIRGPPPCIYIYIYMCVCVCVCVCECVWTRIYKISFCRSTSHHHQARKGLSLSWRKLMRIDFLKGNQI